MQKKDRKEEVGDGATRCLAIGYTGKIQRLPVPGVSGTGQPLLYDTSSGLSPEPIFPVGPEEQATPPAAGAGR